MTGASLFRLRPAAWVIQFWRGLALAVLITLVGGLVYILQTMDLLAGDSAYSFADLPLILVVSSLNTVITGLLPTHRFLLFRELRIGLLEIMGIAAQFVSLLVMILSAYVFRSIWSLVIGSLAGGMSSLCMHYLLIPCSRYRFRVDTAVVHSIMGFARWIYLSSVMSFIIKNVDKLWFGCLMTASSLGLYSIASNLVMAFLSLFDKLGSNSVLPSLSKVDQMDSTRTAAIYYRIRTHTDPLLMTGAGFISAFSQRIVDVLYSDAYEEAGGMLAMFALMLVVSCPMLGLRLMVARKLLKERFVVNAIHGVSVAICIPVLYYFFGVQGAIASIVVCHFFPIAYMFRVMKKHGILSLGREFRFLPLVALGFAAGYGLAHV